MDRKELPLFEIKSTLTHSYTGARLRRAFKKEEMKYTAKRFFEDVKAEAMALKDHATPEEIAKLSFKDLRPDSPIMCIYGQMTGSCKTQRAADLVFACCQRFVENDGDFMGEGMDAVLENVNGKRIKGIKTGSELGTQRRESITHFSAIEAYILIPEAKSASLIAFLKGESDTLEL